MLDGQTSGRRRFPCGYSEGVIHTDMILDEGVKLIQKMHTANSFLRAVREALDGGRDEGLDFGI